MAHRKIVEITFKVVLDVNTDDIPEKQAEHGYKTSIEGKLEDFMDQTKVSLTDTDNVSVVSIGLDYWNDKL